MKREDPETVARNLIKEKYPTAEVAFLCGSAARGDYTDRSDIDLVLVYPYIEQAYREAFLFQAWPVEIFPHDLETLQYFFDENVAEGTVSGMGMMLKEAKLLTAPCALSEKVKHMAVAALEKQPPELSVEEIDRQRFMLTDMLDDVVRPPSRAAQIASACRLYEELATYYLRSQGHPTTKGKHVLELMASVDGQMPENYTIAFDDLFKKQETQKLEALVDEVLARNGGRLWAGYKSLASKAWRKKVCD